MKTFSTLTTHTTLLCALALLLAACGKSDKTTTTAPTTSPSSSTASPKTATPPPATDTAGESSVAFYNQFLGFQGVSESIFDKIEETTAKSDEFVAAPDNPGNKPDWAAIIPPTSQIAKIPAYKFAAPDDFTKDQRAYINTRLETVKQDTAALLNEIATLKTYYTAGDYKDDWHKKFLMAKPRLAALMTAIAKNNKEVYKLADDISEETDRKNIEKSPAGIYILNMRDVIKKARDRADLILDANLEDTRYGVGVPDTERQQMLTKAAAICDQFDALTKEIDAMVAKYKTTDRKAIAGTEAEKIYDGFFASYEKSAEDTRRILRDLREQGYTNDQRTIADLVSTLGGAHDAFLKARKSK